MGEPPEAVPQARSTARACGAMLLFTCLIANPLFLKMAWEGSHTAPPPIWFLAVCWGAWLAALVAAIALAVGRFQWLFQGRHSWMGSTLIGLLTATLVVCSFEAIFLGLGRLSPRRVFLSEENAEDYFVPDVRYGYIAPTGVYREVTTSITGAHENFDVLYTVDDDGFRVSPPPPPTARQHLVFFGCSFTFGTGVNDNETLPAQVQKYAPAFHVYNLGGRAWGPGQMLLLLQDGKVSQKVIEPGGAAIYTFIDDHIARAIGSMRRRTTFARNFPVFTFDPHGEAQWMGSFPTAQPLRTFCYDLLACEQYLQWTKTDIPIAFTDADIKYTVDIITAARRLYTEQFNSDAFYVLIHPSNLNSETTTRVIAELKRQAIRVLDYRDIYDDSQKAGMQLADFHPTAINHGIVAIRLTRDLSRDLPALRAATPRKIRSKQ